MGFGDQVKGQLRREGRVLCGRCQVEEAVLAHGFYFHLEAGSRPTVETRVGRQEGESLRERKEDLK